MIFVGALTPAGWGDGMGRDGSVLQVKHMELEQRVKLARLIVALDEDDREAVVAAYIDMGIRTKRMSECEAGRESERAREREKERAEGL